MLIKFIRHQTLSAANDVIVNHTAKFPIFRKYNLSDVGVNDSVDSQKIFNKIQSYPIKSGYSKKYFGMMRGSILYILNAIGANQHESYYLLDIVKRNTSDIEITAFSGDMHNINRINFVLKSLMSG